MTRWISTGERKDGKEMSLIDNRNTISGMQGMERSMMPNPEGMQGGYMLMPPRMTSLMTEDRLRKGKEHLKRYHSAKAPKDDKIIRNEAWWEGRNWDAHKQKGNPYLERRGTMWTVNTIMGKHADMVEGYPEPAVLPREEGDKIEAEKLTHILPVILEQNGFEHTYRMQAWRKNKSGTAVYGVFWDKDKHNGLGDVEISAINPLNIFFEPGIRDIQDSKYVFVAEMVDRETLEGQYPQIKGKIQTNTITVREFNKTDVADNGNNEKVTVIDWYYHLWQGSKKILHLCKYCGDTVLFCSEDDPRYQNGFYEDGDFPFVMDVLFPMENSIMGVGYIDRCAGAQETIDQLDQAITLNALMNALPRFYTHKGTGVNVADFFDLTKLTIEVEGSLDEAHLREATVPRLDGAAVTIMNNKIEELKQTSGNQDVNNGSTSGVTSASGIAALQQAAGRSSKDAIKGTYVAYAKIIKLVIERIRQFYDMPRTFRILGSNYREEFTEYTNAGLKAQPIMQQMNMEGAETLYRVPEFDVHVEAQKNNPYSKMAQNELGLQLLNAGVFNPQMVDQSKMLIDFMDFAGKERLMQKLEEMGGLQQMLAMMQSIALDLAKRYEPQTAEMIAGVVMGQAGMPLPQMRPLELPKENKESAITAKARQRAAEASQPA